MSPNESRLHPVDEAVLRRLSEAGLDYPTCIAADGGAEPGDVKRRCAALTERGLVEPVSHEVVYRITAAGHRRLEASRGARSGEPDRDAEETVASAELRTPGNR